MVIVISPDFLLRDVLALLARVVLLLAVAVVVVLDVLARVAP